METARRKELRESPPGNRAAGALAALALFLFLCLLPGPPPCAAKDGGPESSFEDRAAAEQLSRSRYRKFEVASLVIIFAAGAGAVFWAVRRRKP
ncbi:MAG: hypothetical protein AB1346_03870 [Thermodesulfobacteriota bacterium]